MSERKKMIALGVGTVFFLGSAIWALVVSLNGGFAPEFKEKGGGFSSLGPTLVGLFAILSIGFVANLKELWQGRSRKD